MNPKYLRYSIRGIILLTAVAAIAANHFRPTRAQVEMRQVKLDLANRSLRLSLENTSAKSLWFFGYSVDSPFYSFRYQTNQGEWETCGLGWCGTGAGYQELKPGQKVEFTVFLSRLGPKAARPVEMQVGINFSQDENHGDPVMVWSETILIKDKNVAGIPGSTGRVITVP